MKVRYRKLRPTRRGTYRLCFDKLTRDPNKPQLRYDAETGQFYLAGPFRAIGCKTFRVHLYETCPTTPLYGQLQSWQETG